MLLKIIWAVIKEFYLNNCNTRKYCKKKKKTLVDTGLWFVVGHENLPLSTYDRLVSSDLLVNIYIYILMRTWAVFQKSSKSFYYTLLSKKKKLVFIYSMNFNIKSFFSLFLHFNNSFYAINNSFVSNKFIFPSRAIIFLFFKIIEKWACILW